MSIVTQSQLKTEYEHEQNKWIVYPITMSLAEALAAQQVLEFPAGRAGRRAAILAQLHHDAPKLAALIESLPPRFGDQPAIIDRLLRAGQILTTGKTIRWNAGHYHVYSQHDPSRYYITSFWRNSREPHSQCSCQDHGIGHGVHNYDWPSDQPHAPYLDELGVACKHVLAAWLRELIDPPIPCPDCHGQGFALPSLAYHYVRLSDLYVPVRVCPACAGAGITNSDRQPLAGSTPADGQPKAGDEPEQFDHDNDKWLDIR